MPITISIPLSDAKAHLSSIIRDVRDADKEYTITLRSKPVARVVPISSSVPNASSTRGLLSKYASQQAREAERTAFADAVEERYANPV